MLARNSDHAGLLRALLPNAPLARPASCSIASARGLIADGLGPLAFAALESSRLAPQNDQVGEDLQAAELTARVITSQSRSAVEGVLQHLNAAKIRPTLLKGISLVARYPQPHQRVMRDMDLLVDLGQVEATIALLREMGFVNGYEEPDEHWDDHHHSAPLVHPDSGLWIEVHRGLVSGPWFGATELALPAALAHDRADGDFAAAADRLAPSVELNYVAAHWYLNLIEDFGIAGLQRALFDVSFLLDRQIVDDQWLLADRRLAFATLTLLCVLQQLGAVRLAENLISRTCYDRQLDRRALDFAVGLVQRTICDFNIPKRSLRRDVYGGWFGLALCNQARPIERWTLAAKMTGAALAQRLRPKQLAAP